MMFISTNQPMTMMIRLARHVGLKNRATRTAGSREERSEERDRPADA